MLAASAVLLLACDDGRPLAPGATDATLAKGGPPLAAPTLASVSASWKDPYESEFDLVWQDNSTSECSNDGSGGQYCYEEEEVIAVLPANSTIYRLPWWMSAESFGRLSVYAVKGGTYSDPVYATYVTP